MTSSNEKPHVNIDVLISSMYDNYKTSRKDNMNMKSFVSIQNHLDGIQIFVMVIG